MLCFKSLEILLCIILVQVRINPSKNFVDALFYMMVYIECNTFLWNQNLSPFVTNLLMGRSLSMFF